jgi:hypothetical protein
VGQHDELGHHFFVVAAAVDRQLVLKGFLVQVESVL